MAAPLTLLCLASYHKGFEFLREAKRQGARVLLVTSLGLKDEGWPQESIDDIFCVPDDKKRWRLEDLILGVSHLATSKYGTPPFEVTHSGGVFTTRLLDRAAPDVRELVETNARVLRSLGLVRGVSHTEYIRAQDGRLVFPETSARVGGAHIAELVEAAGGFNLWAEWAKIEIAGGKSPYIPPIPRDDYAGLIVSLARHEWPDTSAYTDPEVVWRLSKRHHAGLIVRSEGRQRVEELLAAYASRFRHDFVASLPAASTPFD